MIRTIYICILHRSYEEFYRSTLREIFTKIDKYLEFKGLKKPVEAVQEFDDEGGVKVE